MDYNDRMRPKLTPSVRRISTYLGGSGPHGALRARHIFFSRRSRRLSMIMTPRENPLFVWAALREIAALSPEEPGQTGSRSAMDPGLSQRLC